MSKVGQPCPTYYIYRAQNNHLLIVFEVFLKNHIWIGIPSILQIYLTRFWERLSRRCWWNLSRGPTQSFPSIDPWIETKRSPLMKIDIFMHVSRRAWTSVEWNVCVLHEHSTHIHMASLRRNWCMSLGVLIWSKNTSKQWGKTDNLADFLQFTTTWGYDCQEFLPGAHYGRLKASCYDMHLISTLFTALEATWFETFGGV